MKNGENVMVFGIGWNFQFKIPIFPNKIIYLIHISGSNLEKETRKKKLCGKKLKQFKKSHWYLFDSLLKLCDIFFLMLKV